MGHSALERLLQWARSYTRINSLMSLHSKRLLVVAALFVVPSLTRLYWLRCWKNIKQNNNLRNDDNQPHNRISRPPLSPFSSAATTLDRMRATTTAANVQQDLDRAYVERVEADRWRALQEAVQMCLTGTIQPNHTSRDAANDDHDADGGGDGGGDGVEEEEQAGEQETENNNEAQVVQFDNKIAQERHDRATAS